MSEEQRRPDGPLTPEQEAVVASLSADFVRQVDAALLSQAGVAWRKVAMLVGLTMMDSALRVPGLPDTFYAMRVRKLVEAGMLEAEGNLDYMRFSEVRLPVRASREA
jgi:hypothetical protein